MPKVYLHLHFFYQDARAICAGVFMPLDSLEADVRDN